MITIAGQQIRRVGVVDDDPEARRSYIWTLEDTEVDPTDEKGDPTDEKGQLGDLESYASAVLGRLDAVLCDHHLRVGNYADFEGAELVARLYEKKVPAVLCTDYQTAEVDFIRRFRNRVPVLLRPKDFHPDSFMKALDVTIRELRGDFTPRRRPWRTLVHVVDLDPERGFFYVRLPSWTSDEVIKLRRSDLPDPVQLQLDRNQLLYAEVNTGAEDINELYFQKWETD